jgi:hypothetical protein
VRSSDDTRLCGVRFLLALTRLPAAPGSSPASRSLAVSGRGHFFGQLIAARIARTVASRGVLLSCIAAACAAVSLNTDTLAQAATRAARTADFLNILGVNGHIDSNVSPYLDAAGIVADSQYLGIKHWRDGLKAQAPWQIAPLRALVNAGITLVGLPLQHQIVTVSDHIARARVWAALGRHALYALEGPNEPNNFPITYNGRSTGSAGKPTTYLPVAQFQSEYYAAIKADPVLNSSPVWSVTLGAAQPDNVGLQYLTIPTPLPSGVLMPAGTVYADAANIHVYPMWDGEAQTVDPSGDRLKASLDHNFVSTYAGGYPGYTRAQADALPKVITEFGYPATGGTPFGRTVDVPTQGKNILTGLLNAWVAGYSFVNIYDLYDIGDGYGLFYKTRGPKASATHLHNLATVLADTGATAGSFEPGALPYSFAGLPSTGQSQLFQKSNGTFELVVWDNVANWNFLIGRPISITPTSVTIRLPGGAASGGVYDPTKGSAPVQSLTNTNTVTIALSDCPLIIEIRPPAAAANTRD